MASSTKAVKDKSETILKWKSKKIVRMTMKGYNNTQMLFPHTIDSKEQQMNRRVEIMLTGRTDH